MKTVITISIVMLLLAAGFIISNYDKAGDGVKILNDDDYDEETQEDDIDIEHLQSDLEFSYVIETIEPQIICYGDLC